MNIFLDPNTYCYTNEEWVDGSALDRLEHLLEFITDIEDFERQLEVEDQVSSFIIPDDILASSYSMNPLINTPSNDFYFRQFTTKILPKLMSRRVDFCDDDIVDSDYINDIRLHDCILNDEVLLFLSTTKRHTLKKFMYAYDGHRRSLQSGIKIFEDEIAIEHVRGRFVLDPCSMFPLSEKNDPKTVIYAAVCIAKERHSKFDPTWKKFKLSPILLHEYFVPSISQTDFLHFKRQYEERIIFALLQISAARIITTKEHTMKPQKIEYNNGSYGKWNAYVFQNGPNDRDTRCSRIYFAKISGGILLYNYEGDAH